MTKKLVAGICILAFALSLNAQTDPDELKLWFAKPAYEWNNALPVGNGSLGAMVFGNIEKERLQLNEESVWTGKKEDYHNPQSREGLKEVRRLLFDGKYAEAEKVAQQKIMGERPQEYSQTYQTLGDLYLDFGTHENVWDYRRELDLKQAIARVSYGADRVQYQREIFASAPDQVLVVRFTANREGSVSFTARLSRPGNAAKVAASEDGLTMSEHVGNGTGVRMTSRLKIIPEGGTITAAGDSVRIENAHSALLLFAAATDYRNTDPDALVNERIGSAARKSYEDLKRDHIADYRRYFDRVDLELGSTDAVYFATDARVDAMKNGNIDPHLVKLYYQFGRYLLISSSRPGSLPANLQGIWADGLYPPWSADYHININIQMNYWPAEVANLSELHQPYLEFINDLRSDGRKSAREAYGCGGAVAHYTTDVWHFTEPTGEIHYGMWPMGYAWSCQHLWEHYLFSEDKEYLEELAYPAMKDGAEFCLDWLVKDPKTGKLVSGPSISPENRFITENGESASMVMGPTMDHMIIWDLLTSTIEASRILNKDKAFRKKLEKTLEQLSPIQIGSDGRLMEWTQEFEEEDPGHRHISHLFGLHPGRQITKQHNPEFLEAARKTIEHRLAHGGGHTGWSRAWIINFFARLQDGEKAYENLLALLRQSTLHNLFDTHPPFQIDGNFGAVAGITEMLMQSHAGEIHILPALPGAWDEGYIHGICARGGFEVDLDWENGKLKQVNLLSKSGNDCQIRYGDKVITLSTEAGQSYALDGGLNQLN